ncbi:hypothetical protein RS030_213441 [Cryptosporidium xiaoi]|uniref:Uncharacterized protein n=1 Tax=Cryptosporidium xiaoi TaxID=659607 RepID=A0AAV9XWY3_9CRYT
MDSKLSNVVGGILSKTINEKDPVFSQNKTLVKNSITKLKKNKSRKGIKSFCN